MLGEYNIPKGGFQHTSAGEGVATMFIISVATETTSRAKYVFAAAKTGVGSLSTDRIGRRGCGEQPRQQ